MSTLFARLTCCLFLLLASATCFGQSRAAESLMRQAEELDRAGKPEAATAAYQRAERAFNQANDYAGRQKATTALAALSERQANLLLSNLGAADVATTVPAAQPVASPATGPGAAVAPPVGPAVPADKTAGRRATGTPAAPAARLR